jgi:hypothetical protein
LEGLDNSRGALLFLGASSGLEAHKERGLMVHLLSLEHKLAAAEKTHIQLETRLVMEKFSSVQFNGIFC